MTPDLKRLILAAIKAHDDWFEEEDSITPAGAEEVVRAVLIALREPSEAATDAAWDKYNWLGRGEGLEPTPSGVIAAMIDHILAETAKA